MKKLFAFLFVFSVFSLTIHAQSAEEAIRKNSEEMQASIAAGDYEKFGSFFADDVIFKLAGQKPIEGRAAVTIAHKPMTEQGMRLVVVTQEVIEFNGYAHEFGEYEIYAKNGQKVDEGNYSTVWKEIDGEWKIYRDVVSSSIAAK